MKSVGREGRVQFEGGFGEGVKSWVGVAGLRPPKNLKPETQITSPNDALCSCYPRGVGSLTWASNQPFKM